MRSFERKPRSRHASGEGSHVSSSWAKFDVTTGKNLLGPQMSMPQEVMQKLPPEFLAMMKQTAEIVSEIQSEPLKTFSVIIKGVSVFLEGAA